MASRNFDATGDPRALETVLGLTMGTVYNLQNVDVKARLRLRVAAVKPAAAMRSHFIEPGVMQSFEPTAGTFAWTWTDDPTGCAVIVTEAI